MSRRSRWLRLSTLGTSLLLISIIGLPLGAAADGAGPAAGRLARAPHAGDPAAAAAAPCIGGSAAGFPCDQVDLLAHLPLSAFGSPTPGNGNDCWGWTDPVTGVEYALVGLSTGTAFVDLSDPINPVFVGLLPTHSSESLWRDVKVYGDYALIVSEAQGHGMQVFDLNQLRSVASPPVTFSETAHYGNFSNAHNIVVNESTGFAFAVGSNACAAGLHMIDISDPLHPTFAGCFDADGYTHDAQCVIYHGPDPDYRGHEICFNSNEDTITIVDVTDKQNPIQISRFTYPNVGYVHQAWLNDDHTYLLQDDELDEIYFGFNTSTYVWDVSNLDAPFNTGIHVSTSTAIDHNQYVRGQLLYQANYTSGLRVLELTDLAAGTLTQVGYFDAFPGNDNADFDGAWNVYPYFASGVVIIDTIDGGLFVVRPTLNQSPLCDAGGPYAGTAGSPVQFDGSATTDPDGPVASYAWDFGDGGTGAGATPSHTYASDDTYVVVLCATDGNGDASCCGTTATIQAAAAVAAAGSPAPERVRLHQNHPNPFNPSTRIAFELDAPARVELRIYDAGGRLVRTLLGATLEAGGHTVAWDGRDDRGAAVGSGVYYLRMQTPGHHATRKMVLLQ